MVFLYIRLNNYTLKLKNNSIFSSNRKQETLKNKSNKIYGKQQNANFLKIKGRAK